MLNVFLVSVLLSLHPVHVSLASIEYVPEKESFDVFVKIWKDDFTSDFILSFEKVPVLDVKDNGKILKDDAQMYVNEKIHIVPDKRRLTGVIDSIETDETEVKIYMSYKFRGKPTEVTIHNFIMTELYDDQSNMLIFKYNNIEEGIKFTPEKEEQTFILK